MIKTKITEAVVKELEKLGFPVESLQINRIEITPSKGWVYCNYLDDIFISKNIDHIHLLYTHVYIQIGDYFTVAIRRR